ncbi:hypothetical protein Pst134EA_032953 [Puccinia striiformis f. sp. tritici]|uniref:uncharacterized protein n=1 Tax=Puccinia striiformis f. sp. tritici TaxID=168172 RepID=UPI0020085143|nr:uncharacterized protein Pst134EA_032953 [Puccinia striiformis f. sp. tritici]KAH9441502.1 hypothetical protein Pst134EA_032953 [Puccinia striiformis f. sp. tritici]
MPAQPLSIQARILCAWSVPIIKLSRLFFRTLSRPSINSKQLPTFTQKSSHNLTKLKDSMGWIHYELDENKGEDEDEDEDQVDQANVTSQDSKRVTASLKTCLQGYLLTVVLYFVLLIPQNINDHPYNQDYIRDWFTTWNNHFSIAICTLEGDAQSFDDHH